eukprot:CFRG0385T1
MGIFSKKSKDAKISTESLRRSKSTGGFPIAKRKSGIISKQVEELLWQAENSPSSVVDLSNCQLSEVPGMVFSICSTGEKKTLIMAHNHLPEFGPKSRIATLAGIEVLNLSYNYIKRLPSELSVLIRLRVLELSHNSLSEVPAVVECLTELHNLSVQHNDLRSLPKYLAKMPNLEEIHVEGNYKLSDPPLSLIAVGGIKYVMEYIVSQKGVTYAGPLKSVQVTAEHKNSNIDEQVEFSKQGDLPHSGLSRTSVVDCKSSLLRAQSSKTVSQLLWEIEISPDDVVNMSGLLLKKVPTGLLPLFLSGEKRSLILHNNLLSEFTGNMTNLCHIHVLDLSKNRLRNLPAELSHAENLRHLDISFNQFGSIPESVLKLPLLENLNVRQNQITDLAHELPSMKYLKTIVVCDNPLNLLHRRAIVCGVCPERMSHAIGVGDLELKRLLCKLENIEFETPSFVREDYSPSENRRLRAMVQLKNRMEDEDRALMAIKNARLEFSNAHLRFTKLQSQLVELSVRERSLQEDPRVLAEERANAVAQIKLLLPTLGKLSEKSSSYSSKTKLSKLSTRSGKRRQQPTPQPSHTNTNLYARTITPAIISSRSTEGDNGSIAIHKFNDNDAGGGLPMYSPPQYKDDVREKIENMEISTANDTVFQSTAVPPTSLLFEPSAPSLSPPPLSRFPPPPYEDWMSNTVEQTTDNGNELNTYVDEDNDRFNTLATSTLDMDSVHIPTAEDCQGVEGAVNGNPRLKKLVQLCKSLCLPQYIPKLNSLTSGEVDTLFKDANAGDAILARIGVSSEDRLTCMGAIRIYKEAEDSLKEKTQQVEQPELAMPAQTGVPHEPAPLVRSNERECCVCLTSQIEDNLNDGEEPITYSSKILS